MKKNKKNNLSKNFQVVGMTFSQIITMIISIFSFSFIIGGMAIILPSVEASVTPSPYPQGCCREAKDGTICVNMLEIDKDLCKTNLLSTDCAFVSDCQTGCCYDNIQGTCAVNSPKIKCLGLNGTWSSDYTCDNARCQLGCCVLGEQARTTTDKECEVLSENFGFEKNFQELDYDNSCSSKTHLSAFGACINPS